MAVEEVENRKGAIDNDERNEARYFRKTMGSCHGFAGMGSQGKIYRGSRTHRHNGAKNGGVTYTPSSQHPTEIRRWSRLIREVTQ